MKKIIAVMTVFLLSAVCTFTTAYAVPEKGDSDGVKITITEKETEGYVNGWKER